jgi:hypothetical protein
MRQAAHSPTMGFAMSNIRSVLAQNGARCHTSRRLISGPSCAQSFWSNLLVKSGQTSLVKPGFVHKKDSMFYPNILLLKG